MKTMLLAVWGYRYFILSSIVTEFRTRFARSRLGGLWMILNPLAQVTIYAVALSAVLAAKLPGVSGPYAYALYLLAGMSGWSLFTEVMSRSLTVFVDNGNLLKKISFPKLTLPLIVVGSAVISNLLLLGAVLVVFALLGQTPGSSIAWIPLLMLITLSLAVGMGMILGVLNVFMRDVAQIVPVTIQFWFWLTPVVYTIQMVPERYTGWLMLNPMSGVVLAYQSVLVTQTSPNIATLVYPTLFGMVSMIIALIMYKGANSEMADVL